MSLEGFSARSVQQTFNVADEVIYTGHSSSAKMSETDEKNGKRGRITRVRTGGWPDGYNYTVDFPDGGFETAASSHVLRSVIP